MARPSNTDQRRQQIVAALMTVMATEGYERASMSRVAAAAGLTQGLLHYHFPSKRAMLLALLDALVGRHLRSLDDRLEQVDDDPIRQLGRFIDHHLHLGNDADPEALACWIVISAEALRDEEVRAAYERAIGRYMGRLVRIVIQGNETMVFGCDAPDEAAAALLATIQGYFVLATSARAHVPRGSAARRTRQMASSLLHCVAPIEQEDGARA